MQLPWTVPVGVTENRPNQSSSDLRYLSVILLYSLVVTFSAMIHVAAAGVKRKT
jgi:hypothetical protein